MERKDNTVTHYEKPAAVYKIQQHNSPVTDFQGTPPGYSPPHVDQQSPPRRRPQEYQERKENKQSTE
ncbi:hypothetical protein OnM2_009025, partial [Erysiphe neolycopersici]